MSGGAPSVLQRILVETRAEVERRKRETRAREKPPASEPRRGFREALARPGISVIAEFKRRSPSAGELRGRADVAEIVSAYERGGAAAVSVLTEEPNFGGSLADIGAARRACALPLLRKDFIVDRFQLEEALEAGADAVLLIVAALSAQALQGLLADAEGMEMEVLVEVHDEHELDTALASGASILGINNRDLRDFSVDVGRSERLLGGVPDGVLVVSESGIGSPAQLKRLGDLGVDAVLVGESLMRSADPEAALRALQAL